MSQVANHALSGERIDTVELVAAHRVGADLGLRAALYQWTMRDIIALGIDTASGLTQYQSGEGVKARGLELAADKTWAAGARLRGSVSLQNVAYASGAGLLNSPTLLGKFNLSAPCLGPGCAPASSCATTAGGSARTAPAWAATRCRACT